MEQFRSVFKMVTQQLNLNCGLIALVTAGVEQIFSIVVFRCPCSDWSFAYGCVFLMVPALALLVLGYMLNQKTWRLMTGMCLQKAKLCDWTTFKARWWVFVQISTTALVAPCSWVAVAMLHGDFFVCAVTGFNFTLLQDHLCGGVMSRELCRQWLYQFPCSNYTKEGLSIKDLPQADVVNVLGNARAESQIIGWVLIASILVFSLTLACLTRCHSPVSFHQLRFWKIYKKKESRLLENYCAEHAKKLANRNLKSFFDRTPPEDIVTPSSEDWQGISSFYQYKEDCYSIVHNYVGRPDTDQTDHADLAGGPTAGNPAVLGFVDSG